MKNYILNLLKKYKTIVEGLDYEFWDSIFESDLEEVDCSV